MTAVRDWPALMKRSTAAAYLDMGEAKFERLVFDASMPMPTKISGVEYWSRAAIDQRIAILTGEARPDWRTTSKLYNLESVPMTKR